MASAYRRRLPFRGGRPRLSSPAAGRCPSGQRKQAVNLSVNTYGGSNPSRPTQNPAGGPVGGPWPLPAPGLPLQCCCRSIAGTCSPGVRPAPSRPGRQPPDTTKRDRQPRGRKRGCPLHHRSWTGSAVAACAGCPCGPTPRACASLRGVTPHAAGRGRARRSRRLVASSGVPPSSASSPWSPSASAPRCRARPSSSRWAAPGSSGRPNWPSTSAAAAPRRRGRLRRDGPVHAGLVRPVPDAAGPRPVCRSSGWPTCSPSGSCPLLVVAPLFSRDVFSYAAQGEMMSHHINPYHYGPGSSARVLRVRGRPPVGEHPGPLRAAVLDAGRLVGFPEPATTRWSPSCCCACSRWPASR